MTHAKLFLNQAKYKDLRKILRTQSTTGERLVWWRVKGKQLGYVFRRQFNIKNYIVDFYCDKLKLIIEIDGYSHENEEKYERDIKRQQELEKLGYQIIRFKEIEVLKDLNVIIEQIWKHCKIREQQLIH
jgi:very-short-patch-repair endonuclease